MSVHKQFQENPNTIVQISNTSSSIAGKSTHKKAPYTGVIKTPSLKETEKRLIPKIKEFNGPLKKPQPKPPSAPASQNTLENITEAPARTKAQPSFNPIDETKLRETLETEIRAQIQEEMAANLSENKDAADQEIEKLKAHAKTIIDKEMAQYKETCMANIEQEKADIISKTKEDVEKKESALAQKTLKEKSTELLETINALAKKKKTTLQEAKEEILNFAFIIAKRIVQTELSTNPDTLNNIVLEALDKITDKDKVIIRVNSTDLEKVRNNIEHYLEIMTDIKNLEVQSDNRIESGGCIIETKLGYIDASLKTKLDAIQYAIAEVDRKTAPVTKAPEAPIQEVPTEEGSPATDEPDINDTEDDNDDSLDDDSFNDEESLDDDSFGDDS